MTVGEAISRIATRNMAPISPVLLNDISNVEKEGKRSLTGRPRSTQEVPGSGQLVPGTEGEALVRVVSPDGAVSFLTADPLGMPGPGEKYLGPVDRLVLQAEQRGTPGNVDARIGSQGRYGPGLYSDLNALVGALAAEAFPDARARYQLQSTASDLATKQPVLVGDQYNPVAIERPVGDEWGLLINTANQDPLVTRYQQELLQRAGLETPNTSRNPLLSLVDRMKGMAGVPVADVPMQAASPAAQRVALEGAVLEQALQQAKLRGNSSVKPQLIRSETGRGVFAPDPSSFGRKDYEQNARTVLLGILEGRIPLPAGQPAARQASQPAAGQLDPNGWIDEAFRRRAAAPRQDAQERVNPYSRRQAEQELLARIASRATPANVFSQKSAQPWLPGLQVPYSPTLYTPDPIDEVAAYMAARAQGSASVAQPIGPASPRPVRAGMTNEQRRANARQGDMRDLYLRRMNYIGELDRLAEAAPGPPAVVVGPDPVYQQELPLSRSQAAAAPIATQPPRREDFASWWAGLGPRDARGFRIRR